MRLTMLVDVIAITARITIILAITDYGADGAAQHAADHRTSAGPYARKN
jgi:hypothetical protein